MKDLIGFFRFSMAFAGILLFLTAAAKLISSFGDAKILQYPDPLLGILNQHVFWIVGTLELAIALVCLSGRALALKAGLLAWLTTAFIAYRLGLWWIGYTKPCSCLGNLTDLLHIPRETAHTLMTVILAYLFTASYGPLFWLWRQKRKQFDINSVGAVSS
jgi:hypothetical protein